MSIKNNLTQYQKDQNEILEHFVFDTFYPRLKEKTSNEDKSLGLEFFITANCNKKCTYCYLQKHKEKLYPVELDSPDLIVNNLRILLDHFSTYNDGRYGKLDLFSGEIWGASLGNRIFDVLLEYSKANKVKFQIIVIPSNCSFLRSEKATKIVEDYMAQFKAEGTRLAFSCSSDGLIIDEISRPYNSKSSMDIKVFYEKLWDFTEKHNLCFHPMVDAFTIDKWPENLNWWIEESEKRHHNMIDRVMMLEVRNPDSWNDTTITQYLQFLKPITQYLMKYWDNDIESFLLDTFSLQPKHKSPLKRATYFPWSTRITNRSSCSVTQSLCIRLGDLTICPCHRLAYPKLNYGKYIVENDKIIGLEANNIAGMINHYVTGDKGYLKCDSCTFAPYCVKGCHGAQFEYSKEYLYPIPSVCELEKVKILYIIYNIIELSKSLKSDNKTLLTQIENMKVYFEQVKKDEPEVCEKWIPIIQTLLLEI